MTHTCNIVNVHSVIKIDRAVKSLTVLIEVWAGNMVPIATNRFKAVRKSKNKDLPFENDFVFSPLKEMSEPA